MGRPQKLRHYTRQEVADKIKELGSIGATAKFYGVHPVTVSNKVGGMFQHGVKPAHIKIIRAMAHSHTMSQVADELGYSTHQIDWACRQRGIKFAKSGKPRWNSKLTYEQMHNMDLIIERFDSTRECAEFYGVSPRTIRKHARLSAESRKCDKAHSISLD